MSKFRRDPRQYTECESLGVFLKIDAEGEKNGRLWCRFSYMVTTSTLDKQKNEWIENPSFFSGIAFDKHIVENIQLLEKLDRILVRGRLELEKYTNKDNVTGVKASVVVSQLIFIRSKDETKWVNDIKSPYNSTVMTETGELPMTYSPSDTLDDDVPF